MKPGVHSSILFIVSLIVLASCAKQGCTDPAAINYDPIAKKDDGSCEYDCISCPPYQGCMSGYITSDETWTSDNIYTICGKVVVENGVTLTIQPGTIIKGEEGTGTLSSAIVIAKGGKINAQGTPQQPIIFTSVLDNIEPGQLSGTNLDEYDKGLWGGIIILGNAPISAANGDTQTQIEGIPATDTFGAYGGNDPNDNSGVFEYVSIRHGGTLIGAGNEINGLTLGGVGNGTTISNVEIVANLDDGIECFGGTVNVDRLLVGFQGDDAVDVDMNYDGTISNFIVKLHDLSDESVEADGPEGSTYTSGFFNLEYGTVLTNGTQEPHCHFKSKAKGTLSEIDFNGYITINAKYTNCTTLAASCLQSLISQTPELIFSNCNRTTLHFMSSDENGNSCSMPQADIDAAEAAIQQGTPSGASLTGWDWSWMVVNGHL